MVGINESLNGLNEIDEDKEVVMDTPVRNKNAQIKFEESPVFNFLNNLSPIKQVKSVRNSQTMNSLNFTSTPSIFTSPHVATLKESRFLRRRQLGDPSKPEFSSDGVRGNDITKRKADEAPENKENITPGGLSEVSIEPPYECSRSLNYNFESPSIDQIQTKLEPETDGSYVALVPNVQEGCDGMFHKTEMGMDGQSQIDQNEERSGREWENLISDTAYLFDLYSPNDKESLRKAGNPETRFYPLTLNDMETSHVPVGPGGQHNEGNDPENKLTQPGDGSEVNESIANQNTSINASSVGGTTLVHETVSSLYRGMRRRCLVFEQSGARKNHLPENSNSNSPILTQSDGNCMTNDKHAIPAKFRNEPSRCLLPGIGLHLNSFSATSKDYKIVKNESCTSGKQLVISPISASNYHLLNSDQNSLNKALDVTQSERQIVLSESGCSIPEDSGHALDYMANGEFNQTSPKKKRRRSEGGDGDSCKRCNCKKSKCLKLYCECFAAGLYCVEPCSCIECFNKPSHEDIVLATRKQIESRNPLAFAPKVIRTSDTLSEAADYSSKTPASARHKRGCNCKKSGCLKKYCECYQGGVGCSINCRCEGCKNAYGRKDGSEIELEDVDATPTRIIVGSQQKSLIQVDSEQSLEYVNQSTPVPFGRPMRHLPFPSTNKPPRSTFLAVGSSPVVYPTQGLTRPDFYPPPSKFDNNFGLLQEDDIPVNLQTNCSPVSGVKSLSPNAKRVSPPHSHHNTSRNQRSTRKLILQSIPSFPSPAPKNAVSVSSSQPERVPLAELN